MVPLIALDVDGTLLPFSETSKPLSWPNHIVGQGRLSNFTMAKEVREFFLQLHETGRAEIYWHTAWRERARSKLAPAFALPEWPLLGTQEDYLSSTHSWWKVLSVQRAVANGRRVVWLDDDISYSIGLGELDSIKDSENLFMLSPAIEEGLTPADLASIESKIKLWEMID